MLIRIFILFSVLASTPLIATATHAEKPLRVYVLAGQSNMVGTGAITSFGYIGEDPETAPLLEQMLADDGTPTVCDRVWISSLNGKGAQYGGEGIGQLTAGYGFRRDDPTELGDCIGPEYTFGISMQQVYDGPILLIKTAWGGRSLSVDYRPPGSGPYELNVTQIEKHTARGDLDKVTAMKKEATGKNYRYMIDHVQKVLSDIQRVYPEYDPAVGYQLAGFVWFQGWNDYVDAGTYEVSRGEHQYDRYSQTLAQFIRDVRKDLNSPALPFVIGVMGTHGNFTPGTFNSRGDSEAKIKRFRAAMAAPAKMPEFEGNVVAVETAPFNDAELGRINMKLEKVKQFSRNLRKQNASGNNGDNALNADEIRDRVANFREELISPDEESLWERAAGHGGFVHYYGSAKFHAQTGKAFAEALRRLDEEKQ
ncbi:MAG: sialate O-acetylesterase [Rhodopirellula sp. JB044]|uniref:sialate O-acetylesterase n=1 Tax=Rhodopirellula sp. JB044 TaxID=3342844 RepID=UPI00370BDEEF